MQVLYRYFCWYSSLGIFFGLRTLGLDDSETRRHKTLDF